MNISSALAALSAGLDRDEQLARDAIKDELPLPIGWRDPQVAARWKYSEYDEDGRTRGQVRCLDMRIDRGAANAQKRHIAAHDPARTLRQVEAIRRVVTAYEGLPPGADDAEVRAYELAIEALAGIYTEAAE